MTENHLSQKKKHYNIAIYAQTPTCFVFSKYTPFYFS